MKILVLATTFPRWKGDTEPPFVDHLSQYLAKKGHQVCVLVPHAPKALLFEEQSGLRIFRFRYFIPERYQRLCYEGGILPKLQSSLLAWLNLPFFLISQAYAVGHTLCKEKVDLVHVHWILPQGFFAVLWSFWFKVPVVTTIHGSDFFVFGRGLFGRVTRFVLGHSRAITVNSPQIKEQLPPEIQTKTHLLPMGVDFSFFHPGKPKQAREALGLKGTILLGVGRLVERKGFRFLIEALPLVLEKDPSAQLLLIGEGPEYGRLIQRISQLNLKHAVWMMGAQTQNSLLGYYQASDIVILPSIQTAYGEEEGLGLVLAEAMACGIPTIGTRSGGIPSLIEDQKTGLLVPKGDSVAIAMAILRLLSDSVLRESLVEGGMAMVRERFQWKKVADEFDEIFQTVGSKKSVSS